jgi:hypothetical protein
MTRQLPLRLAQVATALALVFFAASVARHHPDAATAAEARFLVVLVGLVLLALSLGARCAPAVVASGPLVALALFLPAAEGSRGALIGLILVAAVAWCTWRSFMAESTPRLADAAAVALAWQALARGERMLALDLTPATLVWLLALPLAAAAASTWLAREHGGGRALIALSSLLVLIPGAGIVPVAVLALLAAGASGRASALPNALVIVAASTLAILRLPAVGLPVLILVGALALGRRAVWRWLPATVAALWALSLWPPPSTTHVAWLALALPAAFWTARDRWPLVAAALALALAYGAGEPAALAPAVGLLALAVGPSPARERWQAGWSLVALGVVALLAGYPWLRQPVLELSSHLAGWPVIALVLPAIALVALAGSESRRPRWARAAASGLVLAFLAACAFLLPGRTMLRGEPVTLTAESATWSSPLDGKPVRRLTLDTFLTDGADLDSGLEVATVRLSSADGAARDLVLRIGEHTADWSSHRRDRAAAPRPWITWLAAGGARAQRYRTIWRLETPLPASRIEIRRHADLGEAPQLAVLWVGAR